MRIAVVAGRGRRGLALETALCFVDDGAAHGGVEVDVEGGHYPGEHVVVADDQQ